MRKGNPTCAQGNFGYKGTGGLASGSKFPGGKADGEGAAALKRELNANTLTNEFKGVKGHGNAGGTGTKHK